MNARNYLLAMLCFIGTASSQETSKSGLLLTGVNIVNVSSGEILTGYDLKIEDNRIVKIEKNISVSEASEVLELDGSFVIPGLIDAHVHATGGPPDVMLARLQKSLRGGVTSVRDMGGDGIQLKDWKSQADNNKEYTGYDNQHSNFFVRKW